MIARGAPRDWGGSVTCMRLVRARMIAETTDLVEDLGKVAE